MPARRLKNSLRQILVKQDRSVHDELEREMALIGQEMQRLHEKVVRSWTHRPRFVFSQRIQPALITVEVKPYGEYAKIWVWVDRGTEAHEIKPKPSNKSGKLKFRTGYSARTAPVAKADVGSGTASGAWRSASVIQHPGTEAREFTQDIYKKIQPGMRRRIENAIRRGIRRANRS